MKDIPGRSDEALPVRRSQAPPSPPPLADPYDDYAHDAAGPHAAPAKKVSLRLLSRGLRRHWWQALLLWSAATAGLEFLAYTRVQPTFDATSQVKVELDRNDIFAANGQQFDFSQFMMTQVATITSPTILGSALSKHPELAGTPMLKDSDDLEVDIRQAIRVAVVPRTNLIQVELSSPIPDEAAKIVNAVVDAYLTQAQATYDTSTQKKIDLLKVNRDEQQAEIKKHRTIVAALAEKIGSATEKSLTQQNTASVEAYKRWSEELTNVEIMVITAKAKLDQLRSVKELPSRTQDGEQLNAMVSDAFLAHPAVSALQDQIDSAERKLREAERLTRNHSDPAYKRLAERVTELNAKRDELWQKLQPTLRRQVVSTPVDVDMDRQIRELETDLHAKTVQRDTLQERLQRVKLAVAGAESDQLELEYSRKDLQRAEGVLDRILQTLNQYQFDAKNPTARVELNYKATPSNKPNGDRRRQIMAATPVAVALLVMGLLLMLEFRGGRVSDPDELTSRMRLQVIGVVPPLPQIRSNAGGPAGGPLATSADLRAERQLDEFVQSLDHLRVALCARPDPWGRDRHCVLITSACGSEGKTTLAAQLAERCVNAGLMTLLIDADLRNPTLSRMLDAADNPGLINVLRGEVSAEDVVMVIGDAGGFHLLPAGTPRVDPSRLLQSDRLGKLIAQARESFDMIIVDAPPVLPVPDALTIGRWTDGAVLAVRYDTSRFPLVEKANRRLAAVGVPVIGAVVNGVRSSEAAYGGYYGYGGSSYGSVPSPSPSSTSVDADD